MKILVTGATGFIGQYVVNELLANTDHSIIVTSRSNNLPAPWLLNDRIYNKRFNLEDFNQKTDYFEYFQYPNMCIHLAWPGLPNYNELFHLEKNLPSQYIFLENLITNGLKRLTVTGTCFEYGMQKGCLSEELPAEPDNAYSIAKHKLYIALSKLKNNVPFTFNWLRLFYMYGLGQNPKSLFSQLNEAIMEGNKVFNMSGGEQERDFLPVETVAKYIVEIALKEDEAGLLNCCSGQRVKVKDWVNNYLQKQNASIKMNLGFYPYTDYEPMSFWGDDTKLKLVLNNK